MTCFIRCAGLYCTYDLLDSMSKLILLLCFLGTDTLETERLRDQYYFLSFYLFVSCCGVS